MKISAYLQQRLICPATKAELRRVEDWFEAVNNPDIHYPVVDGIPILINEDNSLFSIERLSKKEETTLRFEQHKFKKLIKHIFPSIGFNLKVEKKIREMITILPADAKILVVGGGIKGNGMDPIYVNNAYDIVGSDVMFGPYTTLISDAHDIPFKDETFDCVIIQAVLEHVLNPQHCVNEIFRVLKPDGIVYADTPFMQQVHMRQYDFTRFTFLGHRWLFRHFEEIDSGPSCGPGMALAWSYTYFLKSFASPGKMLSLLTAFAQFTSFFLKYFDYMLIDKPGAYDAASGFFFIGQKSDKCLTDKELIKQYKGL